MFHAFRLESNSLKHKPKKGPSWPMFQQDHHVEGCLKYLQVRKSGVPDIYPCHMSSSFVGRGNDMGTSAPCYSKIKMFQKIKCLKFQEARSKFQARHHQYSRYKVINIYAVVVRLVQVLLLLRSSTHTQSWYFTLNIIMFLPTTF